MQEAPRDLAWERSSSGPVTSVQVGLFGLWVVNVLLDVAGSFRRWRRVTVTAAELPAAQLEARAPLATGSFDQVARGITLFGALMLGFWLLDGTQVLPIQPKVYTRDTFLFLLLAILLWAATTHAPCAKAGILLREQTDEWKGWMQIAFLLYHYFAAKEAYNHIRVLIAGYVWLTGYGNFSYFIKTGDYSFWRVAKMLFRLNFLVATVCLVMNTPYMLYYICPMHTVWFLSVYAMLAIAPSWNESTTGLAVKFGVYALLVGLIWDVPGVCERVWAPLDWLFALPNDPAGRMHEWVFRSGLDHWATFAGMLCAAAYPWAGRQIAALEAQSAIVAAGTKTAVAAVALAAMGVWYTHIFSLEKFAYNRVHTYYSWLPILVYIFFRNIHAPARGVFLTGLAHCGTITLETYIGQYHIWMARHDQVPVAAVLTFIPGYPLLNFALNTAIYLAVSQRLFDLTTEFSCYLLPVINTPDDYFAARRRWAVLLGLVIGSATLVHIICRYSSFKN